MDTIIKDYLLSESNLIPRYGRDGDESFPVKLAAYLQRHNTSIKALLRSCRAEVDALIENLADETLDRVREKFVVHE